MNSDNGGGRLLPGLVLGVCLGFLAAAAGAVIGGRTAAGSMGWDELAAALSGFMIGGIAGLVAAIVLARRLAVPNLRRAAWTALAAALLLVAFVVYRASTL